MRIENRTEKWLPIVGTVVLFRILLLIVEPIFAILSFHLSRVSFELIRNLTSVLPIFAPIMAVACAVMIERAIEPWFIQLELKTKRILVIALAVLSLCPWQIQSSSGIRAVPHGDSPRQSQNE